MLAGQKDLPPEAREVAILTAGAHYKAVYEQYAHERIALSSTKLRQEQLDRIRQGEKPHDLDQASRIAYDVAYELVNKPSPLSKQSWDKAEKTLGRQSTLSLIHYCGYYAHACILLNGCDVPVPE